MNASWVLSEEQCEFRFGRGKKRDPDEPEAEENDKKLIKTVKRKYHGLESHFSNDDELSLEYMMCVYETSKEMLNFSDETNFLYGHVEQSVDNTFSASDMNSMIITLVKKNIYCLESNPHFKNLTTEDKRKLLSKNLTEMSLIRGALRFKVCF